jgi:hypothetical protein
MIAPVAFDMTFDFTYDFTFCESSCHFAPALPRMAACGR